MAAAERRTTALITGASGGIGAELAGIFAQHGHDLVLVARSEERLHVLGRSLAEAHGVRSTPIVADLSDPASPARVTAELQTRSLIVDSLVNSAGFATYGRFVDLDPDGERALLQVNVVSLTLLTRLLLPGMIARRFGRILNVASTAAFMPGPLMSVYYASKAYVLSFSEALASEVAGTGVSVTVLCPGPTRTGFQSRAHMEDSRLVKNRRLLDAAAVARAGYAALMRGQTVAIPGLRNQLEAILPRFLPRALVPGLVRRAQERAHP